MQKLNMIDSEKLLQAYSVASVLQNSLRNLTKIKNPEFVEKISELFTEVTDIEDELCELEALLRCEEDAA